jgi:RNA polymerase sigma-70 factor (ECF subfamily)
VVEGVLQSVLVRPLWSDSDLALVDALQAGDEAAFNELVRRFHQPLVRFATTYVRSPELAEDVVQETWLAVLRGLAAFEGRSAFRTWLFQICANRARSAAVRERRTLPRDPRVMADDLGEVETSFHADGSWRSPPTPWPVSAEELRRDAVLVARIRSAIDELPEGQRQVMTLRDVAGLSAAEVCAVMSINEVNQRVLLHRGRTRVRRILAERVTPR